MYTEANYSHKQNLMTKLHKLRRLLIYLTGVLYITPMPHSWISLHVLVVYVAAVLMVRHEAIMLQKLSIMLLSSAQKITYYAFENYPFSQNYATIIG